MKKIYSDKMRSVYKGTSHTPEALKKALQLLRPKAKQTLTLVLGADKACTRQNLALMGKISAALADRVILTAAGQRSKASEHVLKDMVSGIARPHKNIVILVDPVRAIRKALALSQEGELILIAIPTKTQTASGQTLSEDEIVRHYLEAHA